MYNIARLTKKSDFYTGTYVYLGHSRYSSQNETNIVVNSSTDFVLHPANSVSCDRSTYSQILYDPCMISGDMAEYELFEPLCSIQAENF